MSVKAKAIRTLYRANRIDINGVKQAVENNIISQNDYYIITGNLYSK